MFKHTFKLVGILFLAKLTRLIVSHILGIARLQAVICGSLCSPRALVLYMYKSHPAWTNREQSESARDEAVPNVSSVNEAGDKNRLATNTVQVIISSLRHGCPSVHEVEGKNRLATNTVQVVVLSFWFVHVCTLIRQFTQGTLSAGGMAVSSVHEVEGNNRLAINTVQAVHTGNVICRRHGCPSVHEVEGNNRLAINTVQVVVLSFWFAPSVHEVEGNNRLAINTVQVVVLSFWFVHVCTLIRQFTQGTLSAGGMAVSSVHEVEGNNRLAINTQTQNSQDLSAEQGCPSVHEVEGND
ncbi:hypothetical protein J6590_061373 [Homalodisca vitripennis]|nr:hypothetical protein J6590_061373 [Homalodisca vitripennis]